MLSTVVLIVASLFGLAALTGIALIWIMGYLMWRAGPHGHPGNEF